MKNKGFTLIELLAVIVILAIILLIAVPQVLNVIDDAKKGAYESQLKLVENAAETYFASNLTSTDYEVFSQSEMISMGIIDEPLIDPETNEEMSDVSLIVEKEDGKVTVSLSDPKYVKENFLVWLDAIDHGDVDTVWEDLSGNNNDATLNEIT